MSTDCWIHPEQGEREVFVGNADFINRTLPSHLRDLKSARFGNQAYTITHEKIPQSGCYSNLRPLFIGVEEEREYDRIMMERFKAI